MITLEMVETGAARARLAAHLVGYAVSASPAEILAQGRGSRQAAAARQVVMYLLGAAFGMSSARVGAAMGRDRTSVLHGVRMVEARREDARFDRWMARLERSLRAAPEPAEPGR